MPRKPTAAAAADSEAPRRSTRISSLPQTQVIAKEEKSKAPAKRAAKRGADEDETGDDAAAAPKKAKAGTEGDTDAALAEPAIAPIEIGDALPALVLKNEKSEDVNVAGLAEERGVVLFLIPRADTPGCTTQACGFRDIYPDFTGLHFDVYCLSADAPAAQSKWQAKKELPYPLLSDPKRVLIKALGAAEGGKTKRSHYIFAKGGKLVDKKNPVKPADSPKLALEFIKGL